MFAKSFCYYCLMMLKRKADQGSGEGEAKRSCDDKTDPIPRNFKSHSVTLNFKKYTFEQIAPDQLLYLPHCQTPAWIMDVPQLDALNKFKDLGYTMEIHTPKLQLSNLIFLQDDLRVQSNTPTDATAFTQVNYLIHYTPAHQNNYFQLVNINDDKTMESTPLTYDINTINSFDTQVVQVGGINAYKQFDQLGFVPGQVNYFAGFIPGNEPRRDKINHSILDPYIPPNSHHLYNYSGNLQPEQSEITWCGTRNSSTFARNLGTMHYLKYGDTQDITINTNLEGVQLTKDVHNEFMKQLITEVEDGNDVTSYKGQFCYPSYNRPFFCRKNYFDRDTDPVIRGKSLGNLSHHFFALPPILKPNGAVLKQRCTFTLDASFAVTFHFNDRIYNTGHDEDFIAQRNSVRLRPNIYGKVIKTDDEVRPPSPPPLTEGGPICVKGNPKCVIPNPAKKCLHTIKNTWDDHGLGLLLSSIGITKEDFELFITESTTPWKNCGQPIVFNDPITPQSLYEHDAARIKWLEQMHIADGCMQIHIQGKPSLVKPNKYTYGKFTGQTDEVSTIWVREILGDNETVYLKFDFNRFRFAKLHLGLMCEEDAPSKTAYKSMDTVSTVFFT